MKQKRLFNSNIKNLFSIFIILIIPALSYADFQLPNILNTVKAPDLQAKNYVLIEYTSGDVLASKNVDEIIEPASLTKIMTMYVVDQEMKNGALKPEDEILISTKAWKAEGSRMFLAVNSKVPLKDIIEGIIISSANDGSIAVAEHIAGTEESFAELMNSYAKRIGMTNTNFVNATGLPDKNHYTTAKDMALLARAIIRDFPNTYEIYAKKEHTHMGIKQLNRNRLLWRNAAVDGIKTGHTDSAGFCLVASAKKDDMRLISVLMGAKDDEMRTSESNQLLVWGFRFFETHKLYGKDQVLDTVPVWLGQSKTMQVGLNEDLYITVKKGTYKDLKASVAVNTSVKAPVAKGDVLGSFKISFNDAVLVEKPLVALQEVKKGGIFTMTRDYVVLTFKSLMNKIKT